MRCRPDLLLVFVVPALACDWAQSAMEASASARDAAAEVATPELSNQTDAALSVDTAPAAGRTTDVATSPNGAPGRDGHGAAAAEAGSPVGGLDVAPVPTFPVVELRGWRIRAKMTYGPSRFPDFGRAAYLPAEVLLALDLLPATREVALGRDGMGGRFPIATGDARSITLREAKLSRIVVPDLGLCVGLQDLEISELTVAFRGRSATGTASGQARVAVGDGGTERPFTATLTGEVDPAGPVLELSGDGEPIATLVVTSDRLLPHGTKVEVVPAGALPTEVQQAGLPGREGVIWTGAVVRGFDRTAEVRVSPALLDLTGTRGKPLPNLPALRGPGLLAQDGFEGGKLDSLGGMLLSEGQAPIPSGKRALLVGWPEGAEPVPFKRGFTARLAVQTGATRLLAKMRYLSLPSFARLRVRIGHVATGGIVEADLPAPREPLTIATVSPGVGGPWAEAQISALDTLDVALPPGAKDEVVLVIDARPTYCGLPPRPPWLLLDDLRVE